LKQTSKTRNNQNQNIWKEESTVIQGGISAKGILLTAVLLLTGAALLYIGVSRGEMDVVLRKAINICLECIGIG
jgi:hypothetical protein